MQFEDGERGTVKVLALKGHSLVVTEDSNTAPTSFLYHSPSRQ
jgi:hypothetical protein